MGNGLTEVVPNYGNEVAGGAHTGMGEGVNVEEDGLAKREGYKGAEVTSGNITMERLAKNLMLVMVKRGGVKQLFNLGTGQLMLSQLERRERRGGSSQKGQKKRTDRLGKGGLERASATGLERPGVCWAVRENLERKVNWHCCWADLGGERRWRMATSGL